MCSFTNNSVHNIFKRSTAVVGELKQALSVVLNRKYLSRLLCMYKQGITKIQVLQDGASCPGYSSRRLKELYFILVCLIPTMREIRSIETSVSITAA